MLILTRKLGETIHIGDDIKIVVLDAKGKQLRLGVEAPSHVAVHRGEIYELIRNENIQAAAVRTALPDIFRTLQKGEAT